MTSKLRDSKRKRSLEEDTKKEEVSTKSEKLEQETFCVVIQKHPLKGINLVGIFADPEDGARAAHKAMYIPLKDGRTLNCPVSIFHSVITPKEEVENLESKEKIKV